MPLTNEDEELRRQVAELTIKLSEELRANTVDEILRSAKPMRNAYLEIVDLIKQRESQLVREARLDEARYMQRNFYDGENYWPEDAAKHIRELSQHLNTKEGE